MRRLLAVKGAIRSRIQDDVTKAIEVLGNRLSLTNSEQSSVLRYLVEGGDLSQYGLMNAVTRTAEDALSYDRATELEAAGATIVDLDKSEWRELAMAD